MESLMDLNYDWLYNKIIYNSPATLYQQSAVKISICLWRGQESINDIGTQEIERLMQAKTTLLPLPESTQTDVGQIAKVNEEQLIQLMRLLPDRRFKKKWWILLKDKIVWTSQGTIDQQRTAEALADSADFDVETRFNTAVEFCLEDRINALTLQLPNDYNLIKNKEWVDEIAEMDDGILIAKKHFNIQESLPNYKESFRKMLKKENYIGCYYYWHRLTDQDKLDFLRPEIVIHHSFNSSIGYNVFFLFAHCDEARKLEILKHHRYCSILIGQLSQLRWLPIYEIFVKDVLNFSTKESVVELLEFSVQNIGVTITYKNKYVQICAMALHFLSKESSITNLQCQLHVQIINSMLILVREGEIQIVKDFLGSVNHEWIKNPFTLDYNLAKFITIALKCEMLEAIFCFALPTVEEKRKFVTNQEFASIIFYLIELGNQISNIDTIISLLYSNNEEIERFKIKFAEEMGFRVCCHFLRGGNWEATTQFLSWCFVTSKEKILPFFKKFFASEDFASLFEFGYLNNSPEAIASIMKANSLEQLFSVEEIISICWTVFSHCLDSFYYRHLNIINTFFQALDSLLFILTNEDTDIFNDIKKELFLAVNERKGHISLFSKFIHKQIYRKHSSKNWRNEVYKLCHKVVDEFFSWICSSDKDLKVKIEEEFWKSEQMLFSSLQSLKSIKK